MTRDRRRYDVPGVSGRSRYDLTLPVTANLEAWYKADAGVERDGSSKVSKWNDVSGHGRHFFTTLPPDLIVAEWTAGTFHANQTIQGDGPDGLMWTCDADDTTTAPSSSGWTLMANATTGGQGLYVDAVVTYATGEFTFVNGSPPTVWQALQAVGAGEGTPTEGANWTQITVVDFRPTFTPNFVNGLPAIHFILDATAITSNRMQQPIGTQSILPPWTVFFVRNITDTRGGPNTFLLDSTGPAEKDRLISRHAGSIGFFTANSSDAGDRLDINGTGNSVNTATWEIITATIDEGGNTSTIRLDGTQTDTSTTTTQGSHTGTNRLVLGARGDSYSTLTNPQNQPYNGYFGELLIYSGIMPAADIARVETYLSKRFAISI